MSECCFFFGILKVAMWIELMTLVTWRNRITTSSASWCTLKNDSFGFLNIFWVTKNGNYPKSKSEFRFFDRKKVTSSFLNSCCRFFWKKTWKEEKLTENCAVLCKTGDSPSTAEKCSQAHQNQFDKKKMLAKS